jgi:porin
VSRATLSEIPGRRVAGPERGKNLPMSCRLPTALIVALLSSGSVSWAQGASLQAGPTPPPIQTERSIEDLNLLGAAVSNPPFTDTVLGADSAFRRALFEHGVVLRANVVPRFTMNLLDGPVPEAEQRYIGHRPTFIWGLNPVFTADLRQLHLEHAQLNVGFAWKWATWEPAGPNATAVSTLYLFKRWGDRRVEMKAGYNINDQEFVGLQVGGSSSTGAQGVYAVLPFEVGMSYYPLMAPSLNFRFRGPGHTYYKTAAQRSLDAAGGQSTIDRNPSGLEFLQEGNGLLLINEVGFQRPSSAGTRQAWFRTGYLRNNTLYTNKATGEPESGNYCAYALVDVQLRAPQPARPSQGLYLGASLMTVPSKFNAYDRYYEFRVYQRAPFASRPTDVLTFIASHRGHSSYVTDSLAAQGKSFWRSSQSLTGTYTLHLSRGNYLSLSAGYQRGAAITPKVDTALTTTAYWILYL